MKSAPLATMSSTLARGFLGCLDLRARFERFRHEPVHHRQDPRPAQIAGFLRRLELRNIILIERHAGGRRHAEAGVLTKLRITRGRADVPVTIDNSRYDIFAAKVDDARPGRRSDRQARVRNAPAIDDNRHAALHRSATAIDQARVRQNDILGKRAAGQ